MPLTGGPTSTITRHLINANIVQCQQPLPHYVVLLRTLLRARVTEFRAWPACRIMSAVIENSAKDTHFLMVRIFIKNRVSFVTSSYLSIFTTAPRSLVIDHANSSAFRVSFQVPSGNKDIDRFEVIIEGGCIEKVCTLRKSASPLQCEFTGLLPATKYIVNLRTCLPKSIGCSVNVTDVATTTPGGLLDPEITLFSKAYALMFFISLFSPS